MKSLNCFDIDILFFPFIQQIERLTNSIFILLARPRPAAASGSRPGAGSDANYSAPDKDHSQVSLRP